MLSLLKSSLLILYTKEKVVSIYPNPDGNVKYYHSKTEKELEDAPPKPRKCQTPVTLRRKRTMTSDVNLQISKYKSALHTATVWVKSKTKIGD